MLAVFPAAHFRSLTPARLLPLAHSLVLMLVRTRRGPNPLTVTLRRDDGGSTLVFRRVTRVGG